MEAAHRAEDRRNFVDLEEVVEEGHSNCLDSYDIFDLDTPYLKSKKKDIGLRKEGGSKVEYEAKSLNSSEAILI